jgi:hypothetical protein
MSLESQIKRIAEEREKTLVKHQAKRKEDYPNNIFPIKTGCSFQIFINTIYYHLCFIPILNLSDIVLFLAIQHGLKNAFILHQTNDALNKVPPPKKFQKSDTILQGAKPRRIVLPPCYKSNLRGCHEDHPE